MFIVKLIRTGHAEIMSELIGGFSLAMREHGLSRHEARLDACHKRARPIVITTVAMIADMLPIALGWGAAPAFASRWRLR